jgi:hypothetical protein
MLDLASPETSAVIACEQYYSSLLAGSIPALRILWQHDGHKSFEEWAEQCPHEIDLFRRELLVAASGVRRRHGHFLLPPYSLTALCDTRTSPTYKSQVQESASQNNEHFEQAEVCTKTHPT